MSSPRDGSRPSLVVALMHDNAARDFLDSGVMDALSRDFQLLFVGSDRLTADLSRYGPVVGRYRIGRARFTLYSLGSGLWHMAVKRRFELNRTNTLRLATFGMSRRLELAIDVLSAIGLARPLAALIRAALRATAPALLPRSPRPDAVLLYTSVRSYFADDVVRDARRARVPVLAVTHNWDNLNTKAFYEPPPALGVWGEQGFLIARLMHAFIPSRIFVVGAPRFEIYRRTALTQSTARAELGIPSDRRVLLFCGAGVPFEEVSLLDDLDRAIQDGALPRDLLVIYKPHPLRFKRVSERPFDQSAYRHVIAAPEPASYTRLIHYPALLIAADAVISPFSSMVVEGAFFGRPALCVGYNDPGHANHDWNRAAFNLHNYVVRHGEGEWIVLCDQRSAFLPACRSLLNLVGDPSAAASAKAAAEMVFMTGRHTVAERIATALRSVMAPEADASLDVRARVRVEQSAADVAALSKDL